MGAIHLHTITPTSVERYLGKTKQRIDRVGIELEGGWITPPRRETGCQIIHDGSVGREIPLLLPSGEPCRHLGEIPSPRLTVADFPGWVRSFYPQVVNATCGMHIHMSFRSPFWYQRLMTPEYPASILHVVKEWAMGEKLPKNHPLWPRLLGKNPFCQHIYDAESQVAAREKGFDRQRPGHRYTVVNYGYTYHGTIECRLLPMMETADQAVRALTCVVDTTNAFLVASNKKEPRSKGVVNVSAAEAVCSTRIERIDHTLRG